MACHFIHKLQLMHAPNPNVCNQGTGPIKIHLCMMMA